MPPEIENLEPAQTVELNATEGQQVDLANLLLTRVSATLKDMCDVDSEAEPHKHEMVTLRWKKSSYQLSFQASKDKKYNINLTGSNLDKTYVVTIARISRISENDRDGIRITLRFVEKVEKVEKDAFHAGFTIFENIDFENIDDEGVSQLGNICEISVYGTTDVSFLAKAWFPSEGQQSDMITLEDCVKAFWPRFESDQNIWQVSVPELTEGGTSEHEGEKWVWFFASLAARSIILKNAYIDNLLKFPYYKDFIPKRPIDLKTNEVQRLLEEKNVYIPWHIIETACSSLNAKKHVIFTGPPGCGKTTLAKMLAEAADINHPIIATASPNWSSDELIGRYLPDTEGKGIKFSEGFFLKAIHEDKWLIIDELNRADIDSCFGELFTVLSGQPVMLPFETYDKSNGESDIRKTKPIAVYPEGTGEKHSKSNDTVAYSILSKFRMIGTMNDADASRLNQLSYAFQRRFNIIRIEAPSTDKVKTLIEKRLLTKIADLGEAGRSIYSNFNKEGNKEVNIKAIETLNKLFANQNDNDLIKQRVVGVAQILDVIDFIIEGLSTQGAGSLTGNGFYITIPVKGNIVQSYIALALTMSVFPQLMALTGYDQNEELEKALTCILNAFGESFFYRIEGEGVVKTENKLIQSFLKEELRRLFRHVQLQPNITTLIQIKPTETVQS